MMLSNARRWQQKTLITPRVSYKTAGHALLSVRFAWVSRLVDVAIDRGIDAGEALGRASRDRKLLLALAAISSLGAVLTFLVLR